MKLEGGPFTPLRLMLLEVLDEAAAGPATVEDGVEVTGRELRERSLGVAGGLIGFGVEKGDRVALLASNGPEFIAAHYGAARTGAIVVSLSTRARRGLQGAANGSYRRGVLADGERQGSALPYAGSHYRCVGGRYGGGMDDRTLDVGPDCSIPLDEFEWRFSRAGGPGGQHMNKTSTKAEVRFDVSASRALSVEQRERLVERLGAVVCVAASDERSQARNRALALERLADRLAGALATKTPRVKTRPSRSSKANRVDDKRRRGAVKRRRAKPEADD